MTSGAASARAAPAAGPSGSDARSRSPAAGAAAAGTCAAAAARGQAGQAGQSTSSSSSSNAGAAAGAAETFAAHAHQHQRPRDNTAPRRRAPAPRPFLALATAAAAAAAALLLLAPRAAVAIPPDYDPIAQNRTCTYVARGVRASVFFAGGPKAGQVRDLVEKDPNGAAAKAATATNAESSSAGVPDSSPLFPLDSGTARFRADRSATAASACFGPGETYDPALVMAGHKNSCRWRWSQQRSGGGGGNSSSSTTGAPSPGNKDDPNALVDFEEEQACLPVLTSNCYCYSVGRSPGSYCDPGLAGLGEGVSFPIDECAGVVKGVIADGGRPVPRDEIRDVQAGARRPPAQGHYIGLAVMPSWEDKYNVSVFSWVVCV
jgi:hypothetical protein